jgi:hypothetical protein
MTASNGLKLICALLFCAATAIGSSAQIFSTLAVFVGTNGVDPIGPLVQGVDGNLYGTTLQGGPTAAPRVAAVRSSKSRLRAN